MTAVFVASMICSHLRRSHAKARARRLVDPRARLLASITWPQHGDPLQPCCGALIRMSTLFATHVDPHGAGRDAVEHEEAADRAHGFADPRSSNRRACIIPEAVFTCGAEQHVGPLVADRLHDLVDRRRREWRPARLRQPGAPSAPSMQPGMPPMSKICVQAVAEPAVADPRAALAGGELARNRLHREGAAAGHDHRRLRPIDVAENPRHSRA